MSAAQSKPGPNWTAAGITAEQTKAAMERAKMPLRTCAHTPSLVQTFDGDIVVQVVERQDGLLGSRDQLAEMWARAFLVASAPEMLEALLDCRRALEIANFTQELAVVDAAIAKATGVAKAQEAA